MSEFLPNKKKKGRLTGALAALGLGVIGAGEPASAQERPGMGSFRNIQETRAEQPRTSGAIVEEVDMATGLHPDSEYDRVYSFKASLDDEGVAEGVGILLRPGEKTPFSRGDRLIITYKMRPGYIEEGGRHRSGNLSVESIQAPDGTVWGSDRFLGG